MRTFTSQEVLTLTGTTYRMLDHWVTHGIVHVTAAHPGTGNLRTFSYPETLRVLVLATLVKAGVSHRLASAEFAKRGMHKDMTDLVYRDGPVSITLDMRALISQIEACAETGSSMERPSRPAPPSSRSASTTRS